jgi:membrane dipeptidase
MLPTLAPALAFLGRCGILILRKTQMIEQIRLFSMIALVAGAAAAALSAQGLDPVLWQKALDIHRRAIVIDTHCDTPMVMLEKGIDIGQRSSEGNVDLVRMKEGGLDAAFFAIFVANTLDNQHPSAKALAMIDEVYRQVERYPELAAMAFSPGDIRRFEAEGKRAILLGLENGGPIEGSLRLLRDYYRLGIRYITLTHSDNNDICDSSTAEAPRWNGLSEFGKSVVREMNRLGMIVDVSHISDEAFWDVLKTSRAPVIASHSCARALCSAPRNLSDEMIKALAEKGGVVQINFYGGFLDEDIHQKSEEARKKLRPEIDKLKEQFKDSPEEYQKALMELWHRDSPPPPPIDILIDHIDHVVRLVGPDYVGLGSDFDGASSYPQGLQDVTGYPLITYRLLKRGYGEEDIRKILGGNFLRAFDEVIRTAHETQE